MFREELERHRGSLPFLNERQISRLETHFELLLRWNRVLNLSSVRGGNEIVERHYCESLFASAQLPPGVLTIADVGSGGGFPGVPIAIARPDVAVSLIESHGRKAVFLKEATRGLANVRVVAERSERVAGVFDWAVSRAVNPSEILAWLRGHAKAVGLLTGSEEPALVSFSWNPPVKLPWGTHRYWHSGANVSRETPDADVSRETS